MDTLQYLCGSAFNSAHKTNVILRLGHQFDSYSAETTGFLFAWLAVLLSNQVKQSKEKTFFFPRKMEM